MDNEILVLAGVEKVSFWTKFKRRVEEIQARISWYVAVTLWLFVYNPIQMRRFRNRLKVGK